MSKLLPSGLLDDMFGFLPRRPAVSRCFIHKKKKRRRAGREKYATTTLRLKTAEKYKSDLVGNQVRPNDCAGKRREYFRKVD